MTGDRIAQLEDSLARMEAELRRAHSRLAALEGSAPRAARRSRGLPSLALVALGGLALAAAIGLGTASAAPNPQNLTVKSLRIVDGNGLAMLLDHDGIAVYNGAVSVLRGNRIASRLSYSVNGGGSVAVFNAKGELGAAMQTPAGWGELVVAGPDGKARLGTDANTWQTLRFYNGSNVVAGVGIAEGSGLLQVNDATGNKMAALANNGKTGALSIYSAGGQKRINVSSDKSGLGAIDIYYPNGTDPAIALAGHAGGGYFALTNASGQARVEAGVLSSDRGVVRVFGPGGFNYMAGRE